jgi:transcriptional regulator with XRE-family HTH domain
MDEKVERIKKIMQENGLTSSAFAEAIKVNPATITHIIKGRNNVSQNVFDKILDAYPRINPDWLRTGREPMYRHERHFLPTEKTTDQPDLFQNNSTEPDVKPAVSEYPLKNGVEQPKNAFQQPKKQDIKVEIPTSKKIDKIIIFYDDNTFKSFLPEQ